MSVKVKSAGTVIPKINSAVEQIVNNPLEFVPARHPEAVTVKPSSYIVIRNKGASAPQAPNETTAARAKSVPSRINKDWGALKPVSVGLVNTGVTCYMNSAIQVLLHVPAVAHYLEEVAAGKHRELSRSSVTQDLSELQQRMLKIKRGKYAKNKLIARLDDINCMMSPWEQEDSHEFFMSLLGRLQEDSVPKGKKLSSSVIHDIFGGSINQRVVCEGCKHVSTTHQDFYDLSVSFGSKDTTKNAHTLDNAVKHFFATDKIRVEDEKTGYKCDKCNKMTQAIKHSRIESAPEYLPVHLKRFKFKGNRSQKVQDPLLYPVELDLTKYTLHGEPARYELIGVVVHEGRSVSSGHYIAYCKQSEDSWFEFDDEMVRSIREQQVLKEGSAYMLVYSRITEKEPQPVKKALDVPQTTNGVKRPVEEDAGEAIDKIFGAKKRAKKA
ncbi:hypothetical protein TRVA0_005S01068 [Trichomonascus vanleenenianus]|uniref:ubiquitin-specific protease UBP10 n=1 Tax=Trichomonascus vanleenenianus TaxID=2268995 RepID=UPI003ECA156B